MPTKDITRSITSDIVTGITGGFLPSELPGLVMWYRLNSGITITGQGVSQWNDASGVGNHLQQSTDAERPTDGGADGILFNGTDENMTVTFPTMVQPVTIYFLGKAVTWSSLDKYYDGSVSSNARFLQQSGSSPDVGINGGTSLGVVSPTLNTNAVITAVFDSTTSLVQVNEDTPVTGDAGNAATEGFTLGAQRNSIQFSNIQVKEIAAFTTAHDAAQITTMVTYLNTL